MEDDTFFFLLGCRRGLPQSDGDYPGDGYLWTPKLSGRLRKERYAERKDGRDMRYDGRVHISRDI